MFREGCAGSRIDRDQLANDILAAIHENRMDAVVEVQSHKEAPSISCDEVKASYKTLVTFTTEPRTMISATPMYALLQKL